MDAERGIIECHRYLARNSFHGKYSHVAYIVQLCQDLRGVIIEGIKEIPNTKNGKVRPKGVFS